MNKYKPYPKYKESGVKWLGEIPEDWNKTKLKFLGFTYGGLSGKAGKDFNGEDNKLSKPFIPFTNIAKSMYIEDNYFGLVVINEGEEQNRAKKDDLFFLMSSEDYEDLGKSSLLDFEVKELYLNSFCKGFRLFDTNTFPKFLNYLLHGDVYRKLLYTQGNGFTRINLRLEKLNDLTICMPPLQEQQTIANYLDKAIAKIDTLIQKQKRLIELLKEKRQALISHAVTKGLNPNVKMKDSGVEWLGEIPEHWEVKKFKYLFEIKKRISGKLGYDILSITQEGIKVKDIESGKGQLSSDYTKYQHVYKGDFAMNHMDLLTGFVDLSKYDGVTSPDYRVFSIIEKNADANYYLFLLQMGYINKIFYPLGQGSSQFGRWRLPSDAFKEFQAPFPPKEEQEQIAKYIDDRLKKFAKLTEKATKAIELLKEKKTALISAVVTGKIDVRGCA